MEKELKPLLPVGTRVVPKLPTHRLKRGDFLCLEEGTRVWSIEAQDNLVLESDAHCIVDGVCYHGDLVFFFIANMPGGYACELPGWKHNQKGNPAKEKGPREKQPSVEETWFKLQLAALVVEHGAESVYNSVVLPGKQPSC